MNRRSSLANCVDGDKHFPGITLLICWKRVPERLDLAELPDSEGTNDMIHGRHKAER